MYTKHRICVCYEIMTKIIVIFIKKYLHDYKNSHSFVIMNL
jgi:hypothetical protein